MNEQHSTFLEEGTKEVGLNYNDLIEHGKIHPSSSGVYDDICKRCRSVKWDEVAQGLVNYLFDINDSHELLRSSTCRICRMISIIKPSSLDYTRCSLRAFSAADYLMYSPKSDFARTLKDSRLLGIYDNDFNPLHDVGCQKWGVLGVFGLGQHYDIGIRSVKTNSADLALMRKCLDHCRHNHGEHCVPQKTSIRGLRVIDCAAPDRGIIKAPQNCQYAALSYVWGSQLMNSTKSSTSAYSQVVDDAISAALSVGIRYLWVDRHCIDQDDARDKRDQISQMDSIYANSEVTFIAAAGEGSAYGLPGIGIATRRQQHREVIGDIVLLEGFPHSSETVKSSRWATRGWTFQESFFSSRLIIFTDHDVSYLCFRSHRSDNIELSLDVRNTLSPVLLSGFTLGGIWRDWLEEYSRRALTYEEDAMNALLGILRYIKRDKNTTHAWGIPIHMIFRKGNYVRMEIDWKHEKPAKRRKGFPSWSYVSWDGPMKMVHADYSKDFFEVSLGDKENPILHIGQSFFQSVLKDIDIEHRYLHLTGHVVTLSLTHIELPEKQRTNKTTMAHLPGYEPKVLQPISNGFYAHLKMTNDVHMLAYVCIDDPDLSSHDVLLFILSLDGIASMHGLVLQARGDVYERVGFIGYNFNHPADYSDYFRSAFTDSNGQYLDGVRFSDEYASDALQPLWLDEAEIRTVVVG
ncbi:HET-domain-containing protein [Hypoxylon sp. EC38]|nr:HET-domain-containing protein [Hypoxylon sp. EC38]